MLRIFLSITVLIIAAVAALAACNMLIAPVFNLGPIPHPVDFP